MPSTLSPPPSKKTRQMMVRITDETHEELRLLSERTEIPAATLAAVALKALLEYAKAHGGHVTIPLSFTEPDPLPRAAEENNPYKIRKKTDS